MNIKRHITLAVATAVSTASLAAVTAPSAHAWVYGPCYGSPGKIICKDGVRLHLCEKAVDGNWYCGSALLPRSNP